MRSLLEHAAAHISVLQGFGPNLRLDYNFLLGAGNDIANASRRGLRYSSTPALALTRSSSGSYFDQSGKLVTGGNDIPRFDHDPVTGAPLGLLIEKARTNECLQSEDLSTSWTSRLGTPVITTNVAVAPDGNTTADNVEDDGSGYESHDCVAVTVADSEQWTASIYVLKDAIVPATRFPILRLRFSGGTGTAMDVRLNTSNGATTENGAADASGAIDAGDYWRLWVVGTNNATGNTSLQLELLPAVGANADLTTTSASTTGSITVWGAQLEEAPYPSSYIKTTTVSVARDDDFPATITDVGWFNPDAGTFYIEGSFQYASASERALLTLDNGGVGDRIYFGLDAAENINFQSTHSTDTDGASNGAGVIAEGATFKVAGAYADDDFRAAVDGVLSPADAAASFPLANAMTTLRFGQYSGGDIYNGHIARVMYWPARLSDLQLQSLTT